MKPATRDRGIGIDAHGPFGSFSEWGTILEKCSRIRNGN